MDEKLENLGQAIDSLENIAYALRMPIADSTHVETLRVLLPDLVQRLKEGFVEATGENPWK